MILAGALDYVNQVTALTHENADFKAGRRNSDDKSKLPRFSYALSP